MNPGELVVDLFAGGGGASTGIERALGRPVDVAVNHSPEAIAVHAANHPHTRHLITNVWDVDPHAATGGRSVGLLWASPDCKHFSRAKGGKPRAKKIRSLAWVVVRWAAAVRPRVVCLENVEEFQDWGPLLPDGRPCPRRKGQTFRAFVSKLRRLGYAVEWRSLVAADYGAPTTRRRLFMVARADGQPITWPAPTHGKGRMPWRTAAEIIDWSLPCPSIFGRRKPLAEPTMRRIAAGVRRYVLECAAPFVVKYHGGAAAWRGQDIADPLRTVDTANRFGLVVPTLVQTGYGERPGQAPRVPGLGKPLGTAVDGQKHALVAAFITKHYGSPPDRLRAVGHAAGAPLSTVTAQDHHAVTTAFLTKFYGTSTGAPATAPVPTVTSDGWHLGEVRAFLVKYYGAEGKPTAQQSLFEPLHTVTTKARFGLVTIAGEDYAIADIGMRMLSPRELFAAQGFATDYAIAPARTKSAQITLAGNSVCPPVAEAIIAAQFGRPVAEVA
jgi:DNA (cytosine-5)-methyltransferase 1